MRGCECIGIENKAPFERTVENQPLGQGFFTHLPRLVASKPTSMTSPSAILEKSVEAARLEDGRPSQIRAENGSKKTIVALEALAICCWLHLDLPLDLLKGMGFRIKPAVCGERPERGNAFGSRGQNI